jgi:hypothetical protein
MERPAKNTSQKRKKPTHSKKQDKETEFATNTPKCEYCGDMIFFPFECNFCGGKFCAKHRLPENHSCGFQPARTPLGQWKAKYGHPSEKSSIPLIHGVKYQHPSEIPLKVKKKVSKPLITATTITAAFGMLIVMAFVVPVLAITTENPAIVLLVLLGFIFLFFWILASGFSKAKED